jgi:hypothetical protein
MASLLIGSITSLFSSGGAAASGAAATGAAAGGAAATGAAAAGTGFSLSGILQGIATVGGLVASIGAGEEDAQAKELAAQDAEREQSLEMLQGIERRRSIRAQMRDAVGAQDTAYAASGVDLSFGTAAQARTDAYREASLALTSDASTETTRVSRLSERAANYRASAKRARSLGLFRGITGAAGQLASITKRY